MHDNTMYHIHWIRIITPGKTRLYSPIESAAPRIIYCLLCCTSTVGTAPSFHDTFLWRGLRRNVFCGETGRVLFSIFVRSRSL